MHKLDFEDIDNFDPLRQDGFKIFYQRENMPCTIVMPGFDDQRALQSEELLIARISYSGDLYEPLKVRLDLLSEEDLFFGCSYDITADSFLQLAYQNNLSISYKQIMETLKQIV